PASSSRCSQAGYAGRSRSSRARASPSQLPCHAPRRTQRRPRSPRASSRCSRSSQRVSRTARSGSRSGSRRSPSRATSRASHASSARATAPPSSRSRCAAASSDAPCARPGTARGTNYGRGMHADPTDEADEPADDAPRIVPLTEPAGGIPPVTDAPDALARVVTELAGGSGPVAADAERASGYRYGQRTYLVQLRREGAPTALVDPVALPDLSGLSAALDGVEFVLHAASQDLPGFREHGLVPARIFDTELGARLLGLHRVGLATLVAELLGRGLAKEHSAVDWSTRPLPTAWLRYAALDVEVLVELRDAVEERLEAAGKLEWAHQEFEAVRTAPPPAPRPDPWRRTSGMHAIRDPRRLAVVRELWRARDESARRRDIAPGRVLPDRAIIAAAKAVPGSVAELVALPEFSGKGTRRRAELWQSAVDRARALPDSALPSPRGPRSRGGCAARGGARGSRRALDPGHGPRGEPPPARAGAPLVLEAAIEHRPRERGRLPRGRRRETVAGGAHGRAARPSTERWMT